MTRRPTPCGGRDQWSVVLWHRPKPGLPTIVIGPSAARVRHRQGSVSAFIALRSARAARSALRESRAPGAPRRASPRRGELRGSSRPRSPHLGRRPGPAGGGGWRHETPGLGIGHRNDAGPPVVARTIDGIRDTNGGGKSERARRGRGSGCGLSQGRPSVRIAAVRRSRRRGARPPSSIQRHRCRASVSSVFRPRAGKRAGNLPGFLATRAGARSRLVSRFRRL